MTRNRAITNRSLQIDPTLELDESMIQKGEQEYSDWHWGEPAARVMDWGDSDYPSPLVECGRLAGFHVRLPRDEGKQQNPRRERDTRVEFSPRVSEQSHLAYDPNHPNQRLYMLLCDKARDVLKPQFWDSNNVRPMNLNEVALRAGGRHGSQPDYPSIPVKWVGVLTAVIYRTTKRDDGLSHYIHKMGELSHFYPFLCCDQLGRLWIAGGSYQAPTVGITD